jgi:hypothetical protein
MTLTIQEATTQKVIEALQEAPDGLTQLDLLCRLHHFEYAHNNLLYCTVKLQNLRNAEKFDDAFEFVKTTIEQVKQKLKENEEENQRNAARIKRKIVVPVEQRFKTSSPPDIVVEKARYIYPEGNSTFDIASQFGMSDLSAAVGLNSPGFPSSVMKGITLADMVNPLGKFPALEAIAKMGSYGFPQSGGSNKPIYIAARKEPHPLHSQLAELYRIREQLKPREWARHLLEKECRNDADLCRDVTRYRTAIKRSIDDLLQRKKIVRHNDNKDKFSLVNNSTPATK